MKFVIRLILLFLLSSRIAYAQKAPTDGRQLCSFYHGSGCMFKDKLVNFEYNSQSKSALYKRGEISSMYVVCYKGFDYRFAFCAQEDLLEGQKLHVKIYEKKTKKLIYDNANDGFSSEFEFSCNNSISLLIEIILPPSQPVPDQKFEYKGCVGTLIQSRKSFRTGF